MRNPDCILVRLGEIALKSPQVQRRMFNILLDNMKTALEGIECRMEINPNRVFIYTKQIGETIGRTKKVFGVTSVSPAWTCFSGLNDIRMLASDMAADVLKISENDSFAIRAHRVGRHKFSSKEIAEEAGAAVKRVTGARVDLTNPEKQIFIEARSRKTYIFAEKIPAAGGMPVGVSGKIVSIVESPADAMAAWLMMKRGCEAVVLVSEENIALAERLKEWDRRMIILIYEKNIMDSFLSDMSENEKQIAKKILLAKFASLIAEKENALGISFRISQDSGLSVIRQIDKAAGMPVYMPLMLYPEKELKSLMKMIGIKAKIEKGKMQEILPEKMFEKTKEIAEQMLKTIREIKYENQ